MNDKNEVVKVNEFGIEETKANELTNGLSVARKERQVLIDEFDIISKLPITKENVKKFKELRIKFKNNRTRKILSWYKVTSEFFVSGKKFCDSTKNNEDFINKSYETKLEESEKFQEIKEAKELNEINKKRETELQEFELEIIPPNLGLIDDTTWEAMKLGYKASRDAKIKAEKEEKERIEQERIEAEKKEAEKLRIETIEKERRHKTSRLINFIDNYDNIIFAELTDSEFEKICKFAIEKRTIEEKKQEDIKLENEKLKQDAIEREKEAEKQRIEQKKIDDKKEADRAKKEKVENEERTRLQKIEDGKKAELEKQAREAKEKADKLEADAEKKRLADIEAENNRIEQIETDRQAELSKGDNDKIIDLIADLEALKTKYSFDSDENKKMQNGVTDLLTKVIGFINK